MVETLMVSLVLGCCSFAGGLKRSVNYCGVYCPQYWQLGEQDRKCQDQDQDSEAQDQDIEAQDQDSVAREIPG